MCIKWLLTLPVAFSALMATNSLADLRILSDHELSHSTAQNGVMLNNVGRASLFQRINIDNKKLEKLYLTNKYLAEQTLFLSDLDNLTVSDNERLAEQVEMSLITFSTLLSTSVTLSSLLPLLGFPISIGVSTVPDAFGVEVNGVNIDINMNISVRK